MSRKEKTFTLARFHSTLKTANEVVNVNPLILFSRLVLLAEREEETTPCFEYELINYPFSLFKDGMMRNGSKTSLCNFLMKVILNVNLSSEIVQANDGETLLFQIKLLLFPICINYTKIICTANMDAAILCLVVFFFVFFFFCCGSGPSTKDIKHTNRSGKVLLDITFTLDEKCVKSQDDFWDNQNKEARFIVGLSNHLSENGCQCVADADTTTAKIVLEYHS